MAMVCMLHTTSRGRSRRPATCMSRCARGDSNERRPPMGSIAANPSSGHETVTEFFAFTVSGIVTGAIYAVAASGLVVTYTASGVFNFAHGAIGMLMAFTYWQLRVEQGLSTPLALVLVIFIIAPLLGAIIERVLMRNLQGAATATSLVVTVGLMVALIGVAQSIWPPEAREMPPFYGFDGFNVGELFVTWHEAITIGVALAVAIALRMLLFSTRLGTSMR